MGSVTENSHNSKTSSITSHDDNDGDSMAAYLRNLGFIEFPETSSSNNFGVGSTSFSVSSEQGSQKEEISYGGQINGALGKRPANSCVSETSSESPNSKSSSIISHDNDGDVTAYLRNLGFIEFPGISLSNNLGVCSTSFSVSSEQSSQKEEISYGGQVNGALGKRPANSCVFETSSESPNSIPCPITSHDDDGDSMASLKKFLKTSWSNNFGVGSTSFGVSSEQGSQKEEISYGALGKRPVNSCVFETSSESPISQGAYLCGGSVIDMVMMAKTRNCILGRLLGAENKEARGRIFVELMIDRNGRYVFQKIPELMIDPNGHYDFQLQKLFNSCKDDEFQIILRKLISENRFLIDAAFDIHGSFSIQKFIKRLKKSPMASTMTSILSTSFFEMMNHPTARHVIYECLNHVMGVQPNKNTQEAKARVRVSPSDDDGGLDLLDLEQYGFFEIWPETTTPAANPSSLAQFESEDGTTKVPLNLISSKNTQTESIPDSSPGNSMGSTNYITCLNKDCYKCLPFMDTSHSGSPRNLGIGSFMPIGGGGESKEGSTSGTESAAICES